MCNIYIYIYIYIYDSTALCQSRASRTLPSRIPEPGTYRLILNNNNNDNRYNVLINNTNNDDDNNNNDSNSSSSTQRTFSFLPGSLLNTISSHRYLCNMISHNIT